jgi:hypothetical protein
MSVFSLSALMERHVTSAVGPECPLVFCPCCRDDRRDMRMMSTRPADAETMDRNRAKNLPGERLSLEGELKSESKRNPG